MKPRPGISANGLKWIAIAAMFVDHVAWQMPSLPGWAHFVMHFIGRLTMPVMGFLIAQGFHYTRDRKKYALRLFVFALISQLPQTYSVTGNPLSPEIGPGYFNVLFTMLLGLFALWVFDTKWKLWLKISLASLCALVSVMSDWSFFGVLFILAFGLNFGSFKRQVLWFLPAAAATVVAYTLMDPRLPFLAMSGLILVPPVLWLYNGKKSNPRAPAWTTNRWLFYIIFPTHLAILAFLHFGLGWLK